MAHKKSWLTKFLVWRAKHISHTQFVAILSILVGFTSGLGAVLLKNLTHFFQHLMKGKLVQEYHHAFYFLFPPGGLESLPCCDEGWMDGRRSFLRDCRAVVICL